MKMILAHEVIWGNENGAQAEAESWGGWERWRPDVVLSRFQAFRDPCLLRPTLMPL